MSASKRHDRYEEGRRFPRIPITLPVTINYGKNQTIEVVSYDISPEGIQIRCNKYTAQSLHGKDERIPEANRPIVDIALNLPVKRTEKKFAAKCQIIYMIFLEDSAESEAEDAALGLRFIGLKGRSEKYLGKFLFKR